MKIIKDGKLISHNFDYRFYDLDIKCIQEAIQNKEPVRPLTRIKIYHHCIKEISKATYPYMCNIIKDKMRTLLNSPSVNFPFEILPEFNKNNYREFTNTTYPIQGGAWDLFTKVQDRIDFLKSLKMRVALEYLNNRI